MEKSRMKKKRRYRGSQEKQKVSVTLDPDCLSQLESLDPNESRSHLIEYAIRALLSQLANND